MHIYSISILLVFAVDSLTGYLLGCGQNSNFGSYVPINITVPSNSTIRKAAAGYGSFVVSTDNDELWISNWSLQSRNASFASSGIKSVSIQMNSYFVLSNDGQVFRFLNQNDQQPTRLTPIPAATFKKISSGGAHTLALANDGIVYCIGGNAYLQCGIDNTFSSVVLSLLSVRANNYDAIYIDIAAGEEYSLILRNDGRILSFGRGGARLGLGENHSTMVYPTLIAGVLSNVRIVAISAGIIHSLALSDTGKVYAWGEASLVGENPATNPNGVRTPLELSYWLPHQGPLPNRVIAISAGAVHSLFLTDVGNVYSSGNAWGGALGFNDSEFRWRPTLIPLLAPYHVIGISAGEYSSLFLVDDGTSTTGTTGTTGTITTTGTASTSGSGMSGSATGTETTTSGAIVSSSTGNTTSSNMSDASSITIESFTIIIMLSLITLL